MWPACVQSAREHGPALLRFRLRQDGAVPLPLEEIHEFLTIFFAATAAAAAGRTPREFPIDWIALLQEALPALGSSPAAAHLNRIFRGGARAVPVEPSEASLIEWLHAAGPFFEEWRLLRTMDGRTVLQSADGDIDLAPWLVLSDCPDCDAAAQLFAVEEILAGSIRYRNLHSGHAMTVSATLPATIRREVEMPELLPPAAEDRARVVPEDLLARVCRAFDASESGYVLLAGAEGVGKTYAARFLAETAPGGVRTAFVAAPEAAPLPGGAWLHALDGAMAEAGAAFELPPPELVPALIARGAPPERQTWTWLATLQRLNGGRILLVVDDLHRWPESAPFWPVAPPPGIFVLLAYNPAEATPALAARLDALADAGAVRARLAPEDPSYVDLLGQWRIRAAATLPHADSDAAFTLLHLAAARGPLPVRVLLDLVGVRRARAAFQQAGGFLRGANGMVELAHGSLARRVRSAYPERYREVCRHLAAWAGERLRKAPHDTSAADGLPYWLAAGQDLVLTARILAAVGLPGDPAPARRALAAAAPWHHALLPLWQRDHEGLPLEPLMDAALRRADLLLELGAFGEAALGAGQVVARLKERPHAPAACRERLVRALVLRARAALRRSHPEAAAEDARRALDLAAAEVSPTLVQSAHWALGLALAASDQAEAARAALREAAAAAPPPSPLCQDLAGLCLRGGALAEAEALCAQALDQAGDAAERANALARRALVRSRRGQAPGARTDLEEAIVHFSDLLDAGRLDLAADAAQAHHDLAVLLTGRGDLATAAGHTGAAIRLYHAAIDEQGRDSRRPLLARAYSERGMLRIHQGALDDAVEDCTRAIDIVADRLERERRAGLRSDLARACNNRALAYARRGESDLALRDYERAMQQYEILIGRQMRTEYRHHLALVHCNRASVCRGRGELELALQGYTRAVELLAQIRQEHDTPPLARDHAGALSHRALTAAHAGDAATAQSDYAHAVDLLWALRESHLPGAARELAAALHGRGRVRAGAGRWSDAERDFTAALEMGEADLAAALLLDRGRARVALGRCGEALSDLDACRSEAPGALTERGRALLGRGDAAGARQACDAALEVIRAAGAADGAGPRWTAWALQARAAAHRAAGDRGAALCDLAAARALAGVAPAWDAAAALCGRPYWRIELERDRCRIHGESGEPASALDAADAALALLETLRTETAEAARLLAEVRTLRGNATRAAGRIEDAVRDYTAAIAAFSRLAEEARRLPEYEALAAVYGARAAIQKESGGLRNAVADYGWAVDLYRELAVRHGRDDLKPALAIASAERGRALFALERWREALQDLRTALQFGAAGADLEEMMLTCQIILREEKPC